MSLQGKVAIITGAGRGIGRATAIHFAANGAMVALAARNEEQINQVAEEIAEMDGVALAVPTDVTVEAQVQNLVGTTESRLGPVDILVNDAGVMILRPIAETSLDEWNRMINTNLLGAFLCSRAVLPSMMKRRTGRIINIGSLAGRRGYPDQGAYCASKHGVYGLSKVLAIEGQPYGIRVNVVSPGGVLTELSEELLSTRSPSEAAEWMTPEEVAAAVYYIATQDGPATTDELVLRRFASEPWR
ncbi:MAG TPA: SDR family oxidoreductase [Armatimonadota bacterium]|nr:SDR family oxidoreductase [Armatimonadota bacterium]